ncbi:MAG: hypothetical protein GVY13_13240 [Alphaproteobacteria bacterium]|jgi:hypothetical protein|nr:hypothetical protein [Alphaproteobacteria bacterium]
MLKSAKRYRDEDGSSDWPLILREGLIMALWFGSLFGLMVLGYGITG